MFLIIKRYVVVLLNKNSSKEYVFIRIHVFYRTLYVLLFKRNPKNRVGHIFILIALSMKSLHIYT